MAKCVLDKQYNSCPHLGENQQCNNNDEHCGMREREIEIPVSPEGYVREKRWYEEIRK